jgi:hypothetical protein
MAIGMCPHSKNGDSPLWGIFESATQGLEKGVCHFGDSVFGFTQGGFAIVVAGVGVEIFSFETSGDVGTVHLNELEVSEGFAYVGESIMVSRIESIVS